MLWRVNEPAVFFAWQDFKTRWESCSKFFFKSKLLDLRHGHPLLVFRILKQREPNVHIRWQVIISCEENFGFIDWVDNVNWPPLRVSRLTFRALALFLSLWRRTNARNVSFETLYGDQFTSSTQLIIPKLYLVILPQRLSTTVSLETYPLYYTMSPVSLSWRLQRAYSTALIRPSS